MKVLIGYNGSEASEAALSDIIHAGLPAGTRIHLFTVAESWMKPRTMDEAYSIAAAGRAALASHDEWEITTSTAEGSPARSLLAYADEFGPDMIVLGEPTDRDTHRHKFLGQTSQIVLTEAGCTVRIARKGPVERQAERILVGFNGSPASLHVVDTIIERSWPDNTEVTLMAVADSSVLASIGRFTPQMIDSTIENRFARQWAEALAHDSLLKLNKAGLRSQLTVKFGHPKEALAEEAIRMGAGCIFMGPHCSLNSYERFLIGSVSASLAAQAACSVEIVRPRA